MTESTLSDAQLLWADACDELAHSENAQLNKMAQASKVSSLNAQTLSVIAPSSFAQHTLEKEKETIEKVLEHVAFEPITLLVTCEKHRVISSEENRSSSIPGSTTSISYSQFIELQKRNNPAASPAVVAGHSVPRSELPNPLLEPVAEKDATLTFDTFIEADENRFALQAAKVVANGIFDTSPITKTEQKIEEGVNSALNQYNPLFIYGGSGLGKTHLLRAIQNYIALNDPSRTCIYRIANDFIGDYTRALKETGRMEALEEAYRGIDVLILDDIQHLKSAAKTVDFFFDTFNHLISHGKQIVLAADEKPIELGMPERITSRLSSGISVSVQAPTIEFKRVLIETFYDRMKAEGGIGSEGELSPDHLAFMSECAGGNIRSIRSFVQDCLFRATQLGKAGETFEDTDIMAAASERWSREGRRISIEDIQHLIQNQYGISHRDLVGEKRSKEFSRPRHVAIWLSRELTDSTLREIGSHFGGRSHATVKSSIHWVEEQMEMDRLFFDRIILMRERLGGE